MSSIVALPYEYFFDPGKGKPISQGDIYVGIIDLDPEIPGNQKPVTARQEDGTEVPIAQPINTGSGGGPELSGSPITLLVDGAYSLKVLDKNGAQKFYSANVTDGAPLTSDTGVGGVDLLADLIALDPGVMTNVTVAGRLVIADGYEGDFVWNPANQSLAVGNDTQQAVWVAPSSDATGASGAWERTYSVLNVLWFGAIGDGVTNDYIPVQAALDFVKKGQILLFPKARLFLCDTTVTVANSVTLSAYGAGIDFSNIPAAAGLDVKASGVTLRGLTVTGPGNLSYTFGSVGISFTGENNSPAAPTYLTDFTVEDCTIDKWGEAGIFMRYGQRVRIAGNTITNIGYSGLGSWAMKEFTYENNYIDDISPGTSSNAFNIICSRFMDVAYTEVAEPRCSDGNLLNNTLRGNPLWEAIDSKGGERMVIRGNRISGCFIGMTLAASDDGTGTGDRSLAFRNSVVDGNFVDGGLDGVGLNIIGAFQAGGSTVNQYAENIVISNNYVFDSGISGNNNNGAVKLEGTKNVKVSGNTIINPRYAGVLMGLENLQFDVYGNTIKDPYDSVLTDNSCVNIAQNNNQGIITGNYFVYEDVSLANVATHSIKAKSSGTGYEVVCGKNFYQGTDAAHLTFGNMLQVGLDITGAAGESGVVTVDTVIGVNQVTQAVSFLNEFPLTPRVICQMINDQDPGGRISIGTPLNITTTGFLLVVNSTNETNYTSVSTATFYWKADTAYLN